MKKITAIVLAVMMVFALCACGGGDNLTFVTGGEQGTYYAFGTVIAQQVSDKTDTKITAVSGNGSKANVEDLASGGAQLAFCQSDVMSYAYSGTNLFADSGAVSAKGLAMTVPELGESYTLGEAKLEFIGPLEEYDNLNDDSLVMRLEYGDTSFLFTGDMTSKAERDLLEEISQNPQHFKFSA